MTYNFSNLAKIINISVSNFKELKSRYLLLKGAYLVFSSRFGQALSRESHELIIEFPKMFTSTEIVTTLTKELNTAKELKLQNTSYLNEKFNKLLISDDVFVEIRFDELNFELIWELQKDPMVQPHTPIGKSSIRIVLFKIDEMII